jgi:hypothetical protein
VCAAHAREELGLGLAGLFCSARRAQCLLHANTFADVFDHGDKLLRLPLRILEQHDIEQGCHHLAIGPHVALLACLARLPASEHQIQLSQVEFDVVGVRDVANVQARQSVALAPGDFCKALIDFNEAPIQRHARDAHAGRLEHGPVLGVTA